ncbi:MAG: hypothetical protein JOY98_10465 [Candidatus Eremiobacteraeota bacterium]|nr:hypothetical protein [Candidatus Eremiobacteraeota bacterium]
MKNVARAAAAIALAGILAACASRSGAPFVPSNPTANVHRVLPFVRPVDVGRRAPHARVSAVVLLRYNHAAELERFVDGLARRPHPRYLTPSQFVDRYAPTAAQQQRVVDVLQAHGFSIDKTYANRTILDVSGPSVAFERYFSTEMHDYQQGRYGRRYANVRPMHIPGELAAEVVTVDASSVVRMHADLAMLQPNAAQPELPAIAPPARSVDEEPSVAGNVIRNPGFETGHLRPWKTCDSKSTSVPASVQHVHPHSGRYDGYAGTYTGQSEPNGLTSVCQEVTIPSGGQLVAYTWGQTNDTGKVSQFGALFDVTTGKPIATLYATDKNQHSWTKRTYDLSKYAGLKMILAFGVIGSSAHKGKSIGQFLDDVSLTGSAVSPSPSPTPPGCTPGSFPSATPTPNMGPDQGWGPAAVKDAFYFPSNYNYGGACQTAAIVIQATVLPSDLAAYLQNYGITQTGTVTNVLVDGGSGVDTDGEATLDLETIVGLAPDANIIVYVMHDLSDQDIADAYAMALSDGRGAKAINSSFGGCEFGPSDTITDADAVQGAATGVTFSASSGDQGAGCYNGGTSYPFDVNAPASDPHFVGVGGTQSTSPAGPFTCGSTAAVISNPVVWSDCVGGAGGGISTLWTPPPNQAGISGASTTGRNVPDIALPAAYDDYFFTGTGTGRWGLIWGTSWASPIYVAMQTEINQACKAPQWGTNLLYTDFKNHQYFSFIDVTGGSNPNTNGTGSYSAATGFDNVSGIGMPGGMQLAQEECNAPSGIRLNRVVRPTR